MPELMLRAGALYRNPQGAQMRAIEPIDANSAVPMLRAIRPVASLLERNLPLADAVMVLGAIWLVESVDGPWGMQLHLATPEGLQACGYQLVEENADA